MSTSNSNTHNENRGKEVISKITAVSGTTLEKGVKVDFELSFSAKGPLAEHLGLV